MEKGNGLESSIRVDRGLTRTPLDHVFPGSDSLELPPSVHFVRAMEISSYRELQTMQATVTTS